MSVKLFLDTNILVYSFDKGATAKCRRAREIVFSSKNWCVSWQIVQEFCNVALHRFAKPMNPWDLADFCRLVLMPNCQVMPSGELFDQALRIQGLTQYRFYDSLVVASALAAGADNLYSEELQNGRKIGNLTIVNPFAKG
jgi:predicted nucleic acid-binding protein